QAVYHLVTSTAQDIEAIGSDELLYGDGKRRTGGYATLQSVPTHELIFAVVGSLSDPREAERPGTKDAKGGGETAVRGPALAHWRHVMRDVRIGSLEPDAGASAIDATFPWLVHDAMVHLTVPHGLEQYTGGAWGTRDVCQGPLELLLALEHDQPAKEI